MAYWRLDIRLGSRKHFVNTRPVGSPDALRDRHILVVGRDYYFYTREIAAELSEFYGARVRFFPIEPPNAIFRIGKKAGLSLSWWLERYHKRIILLCAAAPPEFVLFIQVHQIGDLVAQYREAFRGARFVLYSWDSLITHDYRPFVNHFDDVLTFDRADASKYPEFHYLPLFFCRRFEELRDHRDFEFDLSFVGVAVSIRRYQELAKLRAWAKANEVFLFDYIVVSPILYLKQLFRGQILRGVHFRSLGEDALVSVYRRSRAVLDLPNNVQSGYTMRTFESLGAHRKLVTANPSVSKEEFYTGGSVFVLRGADSVLDKSFLDGPAQFSPMIERYSLRRWIERLFSRAFEESRSIHASPDNWESIT